jgi:translation initiation factor IF-3
MLKRAIQLRLINEQIFISPITVIDEAGKILGNFETATALLMAREKKTDLVLVATSPPAAVLTSREKLRPTQPRLAASFSFDPNARIKTVDFGLNIDVGAFERKIEQIRRFLAKGARCQVSLKSARAPPGSSRRLVGRIWAELRDSARPNAVIPDDIPENYTFDIWPCTGNQDMGFSPPQSAFGPETSDNTGKRDWRRVKDPKYNNAWRFNKDEMD